jgi:alanine dehydrogenase
VLVLNRREVESLLDLDQLVESLAPAMVELSAGRVALPPRVVALVPESGGLLGLMPVYLNFSKTLATKLVSVFPRNAGSNLPTHQAVVAVFDSATGAPVALMDGTHITAARTAAGSALATQLLARPDADVLVIVGTGVQARAHARAIPRVQPVKQVRVVGRNHEKATSLAGELAKDLGVAVHGAESAEEALESAGIVCVATHSDEPVVRGRWLEPGVHLNSVGLNSQGRELDDEAVMRALVVVESRAAALAPPPSGANELTWPIRDDLITAAHIHAEVGEVISGARPGRTAREQITLYKSVGVAVQDAVAAHLVLVAARERGVGRIVEI